MAEEKRTTKKKKTISKGNVTAGEGTASV